MFVIGESICSEWCSCRGLLLLVDSGFRMLKEFEIGIGEEEKRELEKLGMPQLKQIHETLLSTNPL